VAEPIRSIDRTTMLTHLGGWSVGGGPLYIRLAAAIAAAIERGDISPGSRLPAERPLAKVLAVSRGTVMAAYERLRELGWADSRQGSGTWIRLDAARPIDRLNDIGLAGRSRALSARLLEDTQGVIDLTISAVSAMDDLPEDVFGAPSRDTLERLGGGHGYLLLGLPALRHRITTYYAERGADTALDQVAVTVGAQQAISLVAQLVLKPGDAVIVESPTYPGAVDAFSRMGARLVTLPPATDWPNVSRLRAAISANAPRLVYLMPGGHNPLGTVMTERRRREVADAIDQHEVYLIEDNILADTAFENRRIPPVAAFSRSGRVITLGSLSKVAWGGLRTGWMRGPADVIDRVARLKAATDFGTPVQPQITACAVLDRLDDIAGRRRATLHARAEALQDELARLLPEWSWRPPDSGLALWVRLPRGDADGFNQHAVRHGVDVTPGSVHCADGEHLDCLRIAYGMPVDVLREGVARLARAWRSYDAAAPAAFGDRLRRVPTGA
jgi:DNA-binding transcriptional MocR family regulator